MNGNLLKRWTEVAAVPGPFRILPGGYVMGGTNRRRPHQEAPELIQVNWDGEIVWEYINPYFAVDPNRTNRIFLAHRVPYDWGPQLERPTETAVISPPNEEFRVPPQ